MSLPKPCFPKPRHLPGDLQMTLDYVRAHPCCKTVEVFHGVKLVGDMTSVNKRLKRLADLGLITRTQPKGAPGYLYTVL